MEKKTLIRNSTAEFLIFTRQAGEASIEARYEDETVWLSQKLMGELFGVDVRTVSEHLQNIFASQELGPEGTIRKFRIVQKEGSREVSRTVDFYNLDAIISVGYRVNSVRATQFRQWATGVLREFALKGYVLDRQRMENGSFLGEDYFERTPEELDSLGRIVNAYLELAEDRARRRIPMSMEDWAKRLDAFLEFDDRKVLKNSGKVSAKLAQSHAETEFEKYRIVQDRLFESDFDKEVKELAAGAGDVAGGA